jgi:hypothetical protein
MNLSINAFNKMPIFRGRHNVESNPPGDGQVFAGNGPGGNPKFVNK